jgi:hypothetical protein
MRDRRFVAVWVCWTPGHTTPETDFHVNREVLTVFLNGAPWSLVEIYRRLVENLLPACYNFLFRTKYRDSRFVRIVGKLAPDYKALRQIRR